MEAVDDARLKFTSIALRQCYCGCEEFVGSDDVCLCGHARDLHASQSYVLPADSKKIDEEKEKIEELKIRYNALAAQILSAVDEENQAKALKLNIERRELYAQVFGSPAKQDGLSALLCPRTENKEKEREKEKPRRGRPRRKDKGVERIVQLKEPETTKPVKPTSAVSLDNYYDREFLWTAKIREVNKKVFGFSSFRPNQEAIINAALDKRDCLAILPTGAGKSLCFQLPGVFSRGLTVVISPLKSLIKDQTTALLHKGVAVASYTGDSTAREKTSVFQNLRSRPLGIKLLYVTMEQLFHETKPELRRELENLYKQRLLSRFAFDEAHCVVAWGNEFRPVYKSCNQVRSLFPDVPIIALTATATGDIANGIISTLRLQNCIRFDSGLDRTNLTYEVRSKNKNKVIGEIISFISETYPQQTGIIYCETKKSCERIALALEAKGLKAAHYHAEIRSDRRSFIQKQWMEGKIHIIVATTAFGMGIDKASVRFVIHHAMPHSLENYYQESGRAGRDGLPAHCILYWQYNDRTMIASLDKGKGENVRQMKKQHVIKLIGYCIQDETCRRQMLLAHFGQKFDPANCKNNCDNCQRRLKNSVFRKDVTKQALAIIDIVKELQTEESLIVIVRILRGSHNKGIVSNGYDKLDGYGKGRQLSDEQGRSLVIRMLVEGYLETVDKSKNYLLPAYKITLGEKAQSLENGETTIYLPIFTPKGKEDTEMVEAASFLLSASRISGRKRKASSQCELVVDKRKKKKEGKGKEKEKEKLVDEKETEEEEEETQPLKRRRRKRPTVL